MLVYTDVVVPSMHRQEGLQYDAEVVMSHVYSVDKSDKKVSSLCMSYSFVTVLSHRQYFQTISDWKYCCFLAERDRGRPLRIFGNVSSGLAQRALACP